MGNSLMTRKLRLPTYVSSSSCWMYAPFSLSEQWRSPARPLTTGAPCPLPCEQTGLPSAANCKWHHCQQFALVDSWWTSGQLAHCSLISPPSSKASTYPFSRHNSIRLSAWMDLNLNLPNIAKTLS